MNKQSINQSTMLDTAGPRLFYSREKEKEKEEVFFPDKITRFRVEGRKVSGCPPPTIYQIFFTVSLLADYSGG